MDVVISVNIDILDFANKQGSDDENGVGSDDRILQDPLHIVGLHNDDKPHAWLPTADAATANVVRQTHRAIANTDAEIPSRSGTFVGSIFLEGRFLSLGFFRAQPLD